jgi:putative peptide zinc metalloprotease protein
MPQDAATRELRRQRFRLADGVVASAQWHRGDGGYHLQAPARGEFIAIGEREAVLLSLLDGERSFSDAISVAARVQGAVAPTEAEGLQFCLRLLRAGVLQLVDTPEGAAFDREASRTRRRLWNPFWMQTPLLNPDRWLTAVRPGLRWVFHPLTALLSSGLIGVAIVTLATRWDRFTESSRTIFDRDNWVWLGAAWLLLKVLHEFSHALACKYHGAEVRELGLIFVLFAPMAYVDVTPSWGLRSRWQRLHVAAAGMWTELTVAAIAVLVWSQTASPQVAHRLHNVIVLAGVTTLLFNLNPLMRFDGYYMLCDALGLPNLASRGAEALRQLGLAWVFGLRPEGRIETGAARWLAPAYGLAAALWRIVVTAGLILAAAVMFQGAGVLLSAIGVLLSCGGPLWAWARFLQRTWAEQPVAVLRGAILSAGGCGLVAAALLWAPDPRGGSAPGVIDFADASHVRAPAAGFVSAIHVRDGEHVAAGTLLLELTNDELVNELRDIELQWEASEVRRVTAVNENELGQAQIELAQQAALLSRLHERRRQVESLRVHAPRAGTVVARRLAERRASYVAEGEELCVLGEAAEKEAVIAIDQRVARRVSAGDRFEVRTSSGATFAGRVSQVTPRAVWRAPHPSLWGVNGGPLASRTAAEPGEDEHDLELVEPVIEARVALAAVDARHLAAGQLCTVTTRSHVDPLGTALYRAAREWVRKQLHASAEAAGR